MRREPQKQLNKQETTNQSKAKCRFGLEGEVQIRTGGRSAPVIIKKQSEKTQFQKQFMILILLIMANNLITI